MMIKFLPTFLLLLNAAASYGQLLTSHLQGSFVRAIIDENSRAENDNTIHLWFATSAGLWKFDKKDFAKVSAIATDNTPLPEDLKDLIFDRDYRLWVATQGQGLFVLDGSSWKHVGSDSGAPGDNIVSLLVDNNGKIWVGTDNFGVGMYDGSWHRISDSRYEVFINGAWMRKVSFGSPGVGLPDNTVHDMVQDDNGLLWFGTDRGVARFSGDLSRVGRYEDWCYCLDDGKSVRAFTKGPEGKIWAGTAEHGVFRMPSDCRGPSFGQRCVFDLHLAAAEIASHVGGSQIFSLTHDRDGNLWMGTDAGFCRYNSSSAANRWRCLGLSSHPSLKEVLAIFNDEDNNLWFGISADQGVIRLNNNWFTFGAESDLPSQFVTAVLPIIKKEAAEIWVGTANGLTRLKREDPILPRIIPPSEKTAVGALAPAAGDCVWVGVFGAEVYLYDYNGSLKRTVNLDSANADPHYKQMNGILQRGNDVWIATDGRLSRYFFKEDSLRHYTRENTQNRLVANQVTSLAIDSIGRLWCGTPAGVSVFNYAADRWDTTFTVREGLREDHIKAIAVYPIDGTVWLGTDGGGISIYDGSGFEHLSRANALASNVINQIVFSNSGEVWVATPNGVSHRDTNEIWCTFTAQSGLASDFVETLALEGDSVRWFGTWGAGLTRYRPPQSLPQTFIEPESRIDVTDKTEVTFRFSASDLNTAQNEFRYRYWLDGNPPGDPTFDRFAVVQVPTAGPHTFYVQAIDRDGNLDPEPATDAFHRIVPKFGGSATLKAYFPKADTVTITVYWPPNLLAEDTEISLQPVDSATVEQSGDLLAFDLASDKSFDKRKPMTLAFSFAWKDESTARSLAIYQTQPLETRLGGTITAGRDTITIKTAIEELGRYTVRLDAAGSQPASSERAVEINAQPRIFSATGGRYGSETSISFYLPRAAMAKIRVYNLAGRFIKTVCDQPFGEGVQSVAWNGTDRDNYICPSGLYLVVVESEAFPQTPKPLKVMVMNE